MEMIKGYISSIEQMSDKYESRPTGAPEESSGGSFAKVLSDVKFSKHATKRLDDRQISLSEDQNKRLSEGVSKASDKGIRESLVMVDRLAFIVNVPTQTVITAMDEQETQDHIFTNIDGTVIA